MRKTLDEHQAKIRELGQKNDALQAQKARLNEQLTPLRNKSHLIGDQQELKDAQIQLHFRFAQSVACLVFALMGIPLGVMSKRGGIIVSFGLSFAAILFLYYPVYTMGKQLAQGGLLPAGAAMWMPNCVCGILGLILLWRTLRQ
jgi:lipopolysaccharide export system permease protein